MDEGRAQYYDSAADWVRRIKQAYLAQGESNEWQQYLNALLIKHARKYKLIPLLKSLQ